MRVVVAIDGSEAAEMAVDTVANVRWPPDTQVLVAEAVESGPALFGGAWAESMMVQPDEMEAEIRAEAATTVERARARLAGPGRTVEAVVLRGRPATAIVDRARELQADLIVLGSRGHGTIETMLLGSVSAEVVDHAPMPVLIVRGTRIEPVVFAWDGSSPARRAADLVRSWPIFGASKVTVLSVADIETPWWTGFPQAGAAGVSTAYIEAAGAARKLHEELATGMASELRGAGLAAEADHRDGDAATAILAAAKASGANLIVMGTHGRTGIARLLLGSVARNVVHHAPCSVLVVRDVAPVPGKTG